MVFVLVFVASILKAVADTLVHHFDSSVFYKPNSRFWNIDQSNKFPRYFLFTKYKVDAWHLSNSLMIICFVLAAVFNNSRMMWYYQILIAGTIFNVSFNIFYNKAFRK